MNLTMNELEGVWILLERENSATLRGYVYAEKSGYCITDMQIFYKVMIEDESI